MAAAPSETAARSTAVSPAAEAAEHLYETHRERVFAYCLACLRAREEAEDAVQTTFLYALRALERGTVPEFELPWLLAIARNVCLARHRNGRRRHEREVLRDPLALEDAVAAPSPAAAIEGLDDALARLPEPQRRAILLREWRGLSYREIADELGVSGACVETLIFRARRSLAEQLEPARAAAGRRSLRGFHLGPLAGLKPLFAGSAAKVAVGAVAVAAVVSVGSDVPRPGVPVSTVGPPAVQQGGSSDAAAPAADARELADLARRARLGSAKPEGPASAKTKAKSKGAERPPAATDGKAGEEPAAVGKTVVGTVTDAATGTTGTVTGVAEDVTGLDVPTLPEIPSVSVPDLPVELPPAPKLELPALPVP